MRRSATYRSLPKKTSINMSTVVSIPSTGTGRFFGGLPHAITKFYSAGGGGRRQATAGANKERVAGGGAQACERAADRGRAEAKSSRCTRHAALSEQCVQRSQKI